MAGRSKHVQNAGEHSPLYGKNILLGASASVAAIRVPRIVHALQSHGASVRVVATAHALRFLHVEDTVPSAILFTDEHEWGAWNKLSDPVLHIDLSRWAHVLLIAPTSANTLAKLACGLCDNLLTCIAKAWPFGDEDRKPFFIAPAMNTNMWNHPTTASHIRTLEAMGLYTINPIAKTLACGDIGVGAMEEPVAIVQNVISKLQGTKTQPSRTCERDG